MAKTRNEKVAFASEMLHWLRADNAYVTCVSGGGSASAAHDRWQD